MAIANQRTAKYSNRIIGLSALESLIGFCAATLAIIGLAQVAPSLFLSVATIVVGAALMFQSGALRMRFSAASEDVHEDAKTTRKLSLPIVGIEFLAATIGIALGIISLFGIVPYVLIPISAIALGFAFLVHSGIMARINALESRQFALREWNQIVSSVRSGTAASLQGGVGLAAVVLGIVALTGVYPIILSLVAILSLGAVHILHGTTIVRMWRENSRVSIRTEAQESRGETRTIHTP